jgi:hypothetical protein
MTKGFLKKAKEMVISIKSKIYNKKKRGIKKGIDNNQKEKLKKN